MDWCSGTECGGLGAAWGVHTVWSILFLCTPHTQTRRADKHTNKHTNRQTPRHALTQRNTFELRHSVEHLVPVHTSYTNTCVQGHPKTNTWTWTQSHAQYPHLTDLPVVFVHLFNFIICERTKTSRKPLSVLGPAGQSRRFLFLRRTIDTETNSSTFTSVCVMLVCVSMCVYVFLCVYVYVFVCLCVFVSCPCHLLCHQAGAGGWSTSASLPQMTTQPCSSSPSCTTTVLPLDLSSTYKQLWAEKQAHKDLLFWRPDTVVALLTLVPRSVVVPSNLKMATLSTVLEQSWSTNGGIKNPCWSFQSSFWCHRSLST